MARASIEDPLKVFRFRIFVDKFVRAGATRVTGLNLTTEVIGYREGGDNDIKKKSAGLTESDDIVFSRGQIVGSVEGGDTDYEDWSKEVFDVAAGGNAANYRKDFDLKMYNAQNVAARTFRVYNAFPKGYKPMSDLDAEKSENSFETLTLANEGWERVA